MGNSNLKEDIHEILNGMLGPDKPEVDQVDDLIKKAEQAKLSDPEIKMLLEMLKRAQNQAKAFEKGEYNSIEGMDFWNEKKKKKQEQYEKESQRQRAEAEQSMLNKQKKLENEKNQGRIR